MDEDEWEAVSEAVAERTRSEQWNTTHELLAVLIERTDALLARLDAGVATVQVKKIDAPRDPISIDRPDFIERGTNSEDSDSDEVRIVSLQELARML